MQRTMMKSKIHRATVTRADLHYVGSITISSDLMAAADLIEGEKVDVVDINNGNRLSTYVIEGPAGEGTIGINGAAARLIGTGDLVIVIAYAQVEDAEARSLRPSVVFVDEANAIIEKGTDPARVPAMSGLRDPRV
ncbi:aspartate 1-decarboxylase [Leekyejoonella antrihumi]|uniref:Aspartate 1-decarboxylase n=1 Tax=Leekyejoonella antrihumi TaxID=1660198 RepID=A0A563DWD9_9MICO|nr:aspartate 1-decarboxylase [Leekyejoonella antrihumi]TWP34590.1 aspartate 1-decarboxylase [Leekyejoonella antrihumi]